jgi:hypothetical protein
MLKLPLLVDVQQKVGELVISITSWPSIIILENTYISVQKMCGYGNCDHRYNVSPVHLHALLGMGNFMKGGLCVGANCLCAESLRNTAVCLH